MKPTFIHKFFMSSSLLFSTLAFCFGSDNYTVRVLEKFPHDTRAYTQGLFFCDDTLYETTGQWGESSIRKVDLHSGRVEKKIALSSRYFGEGSCVFDGKLYMLTWTNRVAFVYDLATLKYEKTLSYPREGWGITTIPESERTAFGSAVMVASDGSSNLYFLDGSLRTHRTVPVTFNGRPLRLLNELEWIDGKIWANVYTTDMIVIIDPASGRVCGRIDCSSLIPQSQRTPDMDVLNGIAVRPSSGAGSSGSSSKTGAGIFLTGKNWPWLFRIELVPSK